MKHLRQLKRLMTSRESENYNEDFTRKFRQAKTVKDIEYVRMVDGKPIEGGEGHEGLLHSE